MLLTLVEDKKDFVNLTVTGDSIGFYHESLRTKQKKSRMSTRYHKTDTSGDLPAWKLKKKLRRSISGLIKLYSSLVVKPNYFVSLIFDKGKHGVDFTYKEKRKMLTTLIDKLHQEYYKESWFISWLEDGHKNGLHFHLFCWIDKSRDAKEFSSTISDLWLGIIGSKNKKSCDVKKVNTKKEKDWSISYCANFNKQYKNIGIYKKIGRARRYSRKFIPDTNYYTSKKYKLTLLEKLQLDSFILEIYDKRKSNINNVLDQLNRTSGRVSFLPYADIDKFINTLIQKRNGKSLDDMLKIQAKEITRIQKKRGGRSWSEL